MSSKPKIPLDKREEIMQKVFARISSGEPLTKIVKSPDLPGYSTIMQWLAEDKALAERYARAREDQADTLADELMEIVDERPPTDGDGKTDSAWIAWQRNRIDARKWVAAKMKPKKYGDRQQVDQTVTHVLPIEQVEAKLSRLIEKANG